MIQQNNDILQVSYHFIHIQNILTSVLKEMADKVETIMFTNRTSQIIFSILSEAQIIQCGFRKLIMPNTINSYMQYSQLILVLTLSGQEDFDQVSQFSRNIDKVHILHLGTCTENSKALLKKFQFKEANSIKGFKEENLDFFCYLNNAFILTTRKINKLKQNNNKKINKKIMGIVEQVAIDRLCSLLFSYESFSEFEFYLPKKAAELSRKIKQKMEAKLAVHTKYNYKGLCKGGGMMSSVKTRVIVLERTEQVSPYILSLFYGPLSQQLKIGNTCRLVSVHSSIYNIIYSMDLLNVSKQLIKIAQNIASGRKQQLNTLNLKETKKFLEKVYNPRMSKEELQFHQKLLKEINEFMKENVELLALQQSIGNKIDENGEQMSGSKIVEEIQKWCFDQNNDKKYERYLGLVMEALTVHGFWWYQKDVLIAGISDKQEIQFIEKYRNKCKDVYKIHNLKQKQPKKDEDGAQVRQKCFRHEPSIVKQYQRIQQQVKTGKLVNYEVMKINPPESQSSGKKVRTIVYINDIISYTELAMLLALKRKDVDFVCKDMMNTKEWMEYQLYNA